jgi:hypothetical protein
MAVGIIPSEAKLMNYQYRAETKDALGVGFAHYLVAVEVGGCIRASDFVETVCVGDGFDNALALHFRY